MPAIIEFIDGPLANDPHRVGGVARCFAGTYSAHRGSYRVLHEINKNTHSVTVIHERWAGRHIPAIGAEESTAADVLAWIEE